MEPGACRHGTTIASTGPETSGKLNAWSQLSCSLTLVKSRRSVLVFTHTWSLIITILQYWKLFFQTLIIEIVFSNLIAIFVQMFYVIKIYRLSDRKWYQLPLTALVAALAWASFIALNVYIGKSWYWNKFADLAQIKDLSITCNALAAVADFSISVVLVFLLRSSKSDMKRTNDMISRLILFTFNTGIPTSICALMSLICINVLPNTFFYIFFFLILGRFYTNSLMALLNSRDYVRNGAQGQESFSVSLDTPPKSRRGQVTYASSANNDATRIAIQMDTVKETDASEYDMEEAGDTTDSLA